MWTALEDEAMENQKWNVVIWHTINDELSGITDDQVVATEAKMHKVSDGFTPVGVIECCDVIRKLCALKDVKIAYYNAKVLELQNTKTGESDDNSARMCADLSCCYESIELIAQTIWIEVRNRFRDKFAGKGQIGLRKGWVVGWLEPDEESIGYVMGVAMSPPGIIEISLKKKRGEGH